MDRYDRRIVTAPQWMENFQCIAGDCPETCCQQWNIDVDPLHGDLYSRLEDPELAGILGQLLRSFRLRRAGQRGHEVQYRLMLLDQPDGRCPLLNARGECRLQKKYGAYQLCDTCYFHPRTFWQIDERFGLSACLSCPECARLALLHQEPTEFSQFETEIDPGVEWLETSLISDPGARRLMQNREPLVFALCAVLQDRSCSFAERLSRACGFLSALEQVERPDEDAIRKTARGAAAGSAGMVPDDPRELMRVYLVVFDPIPEVLEKPVQAAGAFTRLLAGGRDPFAEVLARNFLEGMEAAGPFLKENGNLVENFMVHCVFADSFRQFYRCQNDPVTAADILRHERALLSVWYVFLEVQLAQAALSHRCMSEELFVQTVIRADKNYWHYPDWFARCAGRLLRVSSGK